MGKQISCSDVMPGCPYKAESDTEQEVLQKVAAHAADVHGITEITPEILGKIRGAIREQ